ncbi:nucleoside deaminase [Mycolicibacterium sp. 22603]|uniref:nucleoside deaminase n=1 Tax=Mycolicibacterium sp. 22603 TaxID=3453950 RepID=UPI003F83988D
MAITDADLEFLRRCVGLARDALRLGDEPFGSLLVDESGQTLYADHNHVGNGDATEHPEFAIARWAAEHLTPAERAAATVYTSGEHCAMCSAAHAWVGLGRIVYATSAQQLSRWCADWGAPPAPVAPLPITTVAPGLVTDGPAPQLHDEMRDLYEQAFRP